MLMRMKMKKRDEFANFILCLILKLWSLALWCGYPVIGAEILKLYHFSVDYNEKFFYEVYELEKESGYPLNNELLAFKLRHWNQREIFDYIT